MRMNLDMTKVFSQQEMKENFENLPKGNVSIPTFALPNQNQNVSHVMETPEIFEQAINKARA